MKRNARFYSQMCFAMACPAVLLSVAHVLFAFTEKTVNGAVSCFLVAFLLACVTGIASVIGDGYGKRLCQTVYELDEPLTDKELAFANTNANALKTICYVLLFVAVLLLIVHFINQRGSVLLLKMWVVCFATAISAASASEAWRDMTSLQFVKK